MNVHVLACACIYFPEISLTVSYTRARQLGLLGLLHRETMSQHHPPPKKNKEEEEKGGGGRRGGRGGGRGGGGDSK